MKTRLILLALIVALATGIATAQQGLTLLGAGSTKSGGGLVTGWTYVQSTSHGCGSNQSSCSATVTALGTGHLVVVFAFMKGSNFSTATISSVTGGGTYTECNACRVNDGSAIALDVAYILSTDSSAPTTVTANMSQTIGTNLRVEVREYSFTGGPAALDVHNTIYDSVAGTPQAGAALSPTGSNDVIVRCAGVNTANVNSIDSSYLHFTNSGPSASAEKITTTGTAPNWTLSASDVLIESALAFH